VAIQVTAGPGGGGGRAEWLIGHDGWRRGIYRSGPVIGAREARTVVPFTVLPDCVGVELQEGRLPAGQGRVPRRFVGLKGFLHQSRERSEHKTPQSSPEMVLVALGFSSGAQKRTWSPGPLPSRKRPGCALSRHLHPQLSPHRAFHRTLRPAVGWGRGWRVSGPRLRADRRPYAPSTSEEACPRHSPNEGSSYENSGLISREFFQRRTLGKKNKAVQPRKMASPKNLMPQSPAVSPQRLHSFACV